jgi:hypothetical protein
MNTILTFLLAYGLLAILYRFGLRPLFQSAIYERIQQREHELEKLADAGVVSKEDFTFQYLLKRFRLKDHLAHCSVSDFLHFMVSNRLPKPAMEDFKRFQSEAGPELESCNREFCKDFGLWMTLNSPIYTLMTFGIIAALILCRYMDEQTAKRKAIVFVGTESCGSAA